MKNSTLARTLMPLILLLFSLNISAQDSLDLRIMTFNSVFGSALETDKVNSTLNIIRTVEADVIVIQEDFLFNSFSWALQNGLPGYKRHVVKSWWTPWGTNAIISKFPIVQINDRGAKLQVGENEFVWVYAVHLTPWFTGDADLYTSDNPLVQIYGDIVTSILPYVWTSFVNCGVETDIAIVEEESKAPHDRELDQIFNRIDDHDEDPTPIIMMGDFNEPSHLDWTQAAADAGIYGAAVNWYVSNFLEDRGFQDAFRVKYPDEVDRLGISFNAPEADLLCPEDRSFRIDYSYYKGNIGFDDIFMVGDQAEFVDSVFTDYDSDHFVLVADYKLLDTEELISYEEERIALSSFPNPFHDKVTIEINSTEAVNVQLDIYNQMGAKVHSLAQQEVYQGTNHFNWDPEKRLAKGIYIAVVTVDGEQPYAIKLLKY